MNNWRSRNKNAEKNFYMTAQTTRCSIHACVFGTMAVLLAAVLSVCFLVANEAEAKTIVHKLNVTVSNLESEDHVYMLLSEDHILSTINNRLATANPTEKAKITAYKNEKDYVSYLQDVVQKPYYYDTFFAWYPTGCEMSEPSRIVDQVIVNGKPYVRILADMSASNTFTEEMLIEHYWRVDSLVMIENTSGQRKYASMEKNIYKKPALDYICEVPIDASKLPVGKVTSVVGEYASDFTDVTSFTDHPMEVEWMRTEKISTGWDEPDGSVSYRPYAFVERADMAAFLYRLASKWNVPGAADYVPSSSDRKAFRDVNANTPHAKEIWWCAKQGISEGWKVDSSKEFRPYWNVARQDMAAFIYRLAMVAGADKTWSIPDGAEAFADLSMTASDNHHFEVMWLKSHGIAEGFTNSATGKQEFRGESPIARCDMAAFLYRADYCRWLNLL